MNPETKTQEEGEESKRLWTLKDCQAVRKQLELNGKIV